MLSLLQSQHGAVLQSRRRLPCLLMLCAKACDTFQSYQHLVGPSLAAQVCMQ